MATIDVINDATYPRISSITTTGGAVPYDVTVWVEARVIADPGYSILTVSAQLWLVGTAGVDSQIGSDVTLSPSAPGSDVYTGSFVTSGALQPTNFVYVKILGAATYQLTDTSSTVANVV